jgi:hypothetical protein
MISILHGPVAIFKVWVLTSFLYSEKKLIKKIAFLVKMARKAVKKAFDSIWHDALLHKLIQRGCNIFLA